MLACQVACLAALGNGGCTGVVFAAICGIEVAECAGTVSISWDGQVVDVVCEWSVFGLRREPSEVDAEEDTGAVGVCLSLYGASDD